MRPAAAEAIRPACDIRNRGRPAGWRFERVARTGARHAWIPRNAMPNVSRP